jgi:hypothetical protein
MGKLLAFGLLGVIVIGGAIGSIGNDKSHGSTTAASDRPGAATVYREIATTYDCPRLQEMFDTAADNNDRHQAGSFLFKVTLSYMTTTQDRMEQVGCFD